MVRPKSFYLELVQVWYFFATVVQEFDGIFESFDIFFIKQKGIISIYLEPHKCLKALHHRNIIVMKQKLD
jgi:hypothetical protein